MAFTVADVLSRTTKLLQDASGSRWSYAEQIDWINDALREIAIHKPTATAQTVEITLKKGTLQYLPAEYQTLVTVTRNLFTIDSDTDGRSGGRSITPVSRQLVDSFLPRWHDPDFIPYAKEVRHVVVNTDNPRSFFVVPGNDGTGVVEAVVSAVPAKISTPPAPGAIESYTEAVPIDDLYLNAVVDYTCYRAFSKDMVLAGAAQRAQGHYALFAQALGLKIKAEMINPNAPTQKPQP